MKQLNLILVISAIFSIVLLIGQINVNVANAQTAFSIIDDFELGIKGMSYQSTTDTVWVLSSQGTQEVYLYEVDRQSAVINDVHNLTQDWVDNGYSYAQDIWCGKTDCFITHNSGTSGGIVRISTAEDGTFPNIFKGENVTGYWGSPVAAGSFKITGRDEVVAGFGTITMWVDGCSEGGATCDGRIRVVDGISMLMAAEFPIYSATNNNAVKVHEMEWSGISGVVDNDLVTTIGFITDTGASNYLRIYNLATGALKCETQLPSSNNPYGVDVNDFGSLTEYKLYVGSIDGIVYTYDDDCNLEQTISGAVTGLGGDVRYVQYSSGRIFIQETGANANIVHMVTNSTGHILTNEILSYQPLPSSSQNMFDAVSTSTTVGNAILFAGNGELWFPYTGDNAGDRKIGILTYDGSADSGTVEACFDINPSPLIVQEICLTDIDGDGVVDAPSNTFIARAGKNVTSIGNDLLCQIGVLADSDFDGTCDNYDVKTNGVGYLLIILLFGFMIAMFAVAKLKTHLSIPEWLWIVGTFAVLGAGIGLQWIDTTLFIIGCVIVAGMASFRIYSAIQGKLGGGE